MVTRTITVGDTEFTTVLEELRGAVRQQHAMKDAKQATDDERNEAQRRILILSSVIQQLEQE
jgi:hypothetical protein